MTQDNESSDENEEALEAAKDEVDEEPDPGLGPAADEGGEPVSNSDEETDTDEETEN